MSTWAFAKRFRREFNGPGPLHQKSFSWRDHEHVQDFQGFGTEVPLMTISRSLRRHSHEIDGHAFAETFRRIGKIVHDRSKLLICPHPALACVLRLRPA